MNSKNKIIIFDLWQTLADSTIRPSDLFDILYPADKTISKNNFLKILFKSDLYSKDISLEKGLNSFLLNLGIPDKEKLGKTILLWKEMIKKSYLFDEANDLLLSLKSKGYKLCLLTNVDKYGHENFPFNDFLNLFDYQFFSYKNGLTKPNLRCWEIIKDYYRFSYENMTMIGDSIKDDITVVKSLGISTILIDTSNKKGMYNEIYAKFINNQFYDKTS